MEGMRLKYLLDMINAIDDKEYVVIKTGAGYGLCLPGRKTPLHDPIENRHDMILYLRGFKGAVTLKANGAKK